MGRGLRGAHPAWFVVGVAAWMLRRARSEAPARYRAELRPGERLLITAAPRTGRG
jgi:hypothetical protein